MLFDMDRAKKHFRKDVRFAKNKFGTIEERIRELEKAYNTYIKFMYDVDGALWRAGEYVHEQIDNKGVPRQLLPWDKKTRDIRNEAASTPWVFKDMITALKQFDELAKNIPDKAKK